MLASIAQDVRYAARSLRRSPGFTAVVVVTLALGIGGTTAVFSVLDATLLNPVPLPDPDRLVLVYSTNANGDRNSISYLNYLDWRARARSFDQLAAFRGVSLTLTGEGLPERLVGTMASANFFEALGIQPLFGRTFRAAEDHRGSSGVAILGEGFWRRRFAAHPDAIGRKLTLNGRDYTVIGVMPERARLIRDGVFLNDVVIPIGQTDDPLFYDRGVNNGTVGFGRLARRVSLEQARAEMDTIARTLAAAFPADNAGVGTFVLSLKDDLLGGRESTLLALFAAVGFVLLIACTNVANLLLARGARRSHEFAIRAALGAGQHRLIQQQLVESCLVVGIGGICGLLLALVGTGAVLRVLPAALSMLTEPAIDMRALAFTAVVSLMCGILVGLVPAIRAIRAKLQPSLVQAGRGIASRRSFAQRTLIVSEVALTVVLLAATGLLIRSLTRLWAVDPGFDANNVIVFSTGLSPERAATPDDIRNSMRQLGDRMAAVPGVESASVEIGVLPFGNGSTDFGFWPASEPQPRNDEMQEALFYGVGPEYLDVMRIPLRRGRAFTRRDDTRAPRVALVDEEFARRVFPGRDAVGERIRLGFVNEPIEIVGVVGHVKHWGLDRDDTARMRAQLYMPYMQLADVVAPLIPNNINVVVRSGIRLGALIPVLRREVASFDNTQTIGNEQSLIDLIARSMATRRLSLFVLGSFAALALFLACVGIYGVVSYLTSQRTSEIGVRMALGARPWDVLLMVLAHGQRLAGLGIAFGLLAAAGLTRFLSNLLYGVSAIDPITFGTVSVLLIVVVLVACYVPARRAARVDPIVALRAE
jgi:predicted permease